MAAAGRPDSTIFQLNRYLTRSRALIADTINPFCDCFVRLPYTALYLATACVKTVAFRRKDERYGRTWCMNVERERPSKRLATC